MNTQTLHVHVRSVWLQHSFLCASRIAAYAFVCVCAWWCLFMTFNIKSRAIDKVLNALRTQKTRVSVTSRRTQVENSRTKTRTSNTLSSNSIVLINA